MSDRLTKSHWIRHGMATLARHGPNALKVAPMATALQVSRGSFYWHFADIADFQAQLLQNWQERTTDQVILDLDAHAAPDRLKQLLRRAFVGKRGLDPAIRAWAATDGDVARVVGGVDAQRIAHIAKILVAAGVAPPKAQRRAGFLYWAYLGQALVMDPRHASIAAAMIDDLCDLFER